MRNKSQLLQTNDAMLCVMHTVL